MGYVEFVEGIACVCARVFSLTENVFLLDTDQPKGLLVFGVFTSTR